MSARGKPQGQFVNDLLRTEFHKYVITGTRGYMSLKYGTFIPGNSWQNSLRYEFLRCYSMSTHDIYSNKRIVIPMYLLYVKYVFIEKNLPARGAIPNPRQPIPASRSRTPLSLSYTSRHVGRCITFPA